MPNQFFFGASLKCSIEHLENDTIFWELFRGQALDQAKTRRQQTFEAWNLYDRDDSTSHREPLLSVKLDWPAKQIHVTRSIASRSFETHSSDSTIHSREVVRRIRELVGTLDLNRLTTTTEVEDELIALLFFAVVGTSRLSLTSLEAPLPEFTLGQFAYCPGSGGDDSPIVSPEELIGVGLQADRAAFERVRALEAAIRAERIENVSDLAETFSLACLKGRFPLNDLPTLLRDIFNNIALSPYTDFVAKVLRFAKWSLHEDDEIDFLTHLLRQLGRHLTSFDLIRFHHRGANYPDALLLDEVLARVIEIAEASPALFLAAHSDNVSDLSRKRLRRRGIRSAWLICRQYRGHLVPDAPTSPGENTRVLPEPFSPVPEEQILDPSTRTRKLFLDRQFDDRQVVIDILRQSVADLAQDCERSELGLGLFLDRPLGFAKKIGEPDRTTLLSHLAFSLEIAHTRLRLLNEIAAVCSSAFDHVPSGVSSRQCAAIPRPGVASVRDAELAADDFRLLQTTRKTVRDLLEAYDFSLLNESGIVPWLQTENCLIVPSSQSPRELLIYDSMACERLRLRLDDSRGYVSRAGIETLAAGLVVVSACDEHGQPVSNSSGKQLASRA